MSLRRRLLRWIAAPARSAFETALNDLIDDAIEHRGVVRQGELDALSDRVASLQRAAAERGAEIAALQQAVQALEGDDDLAAMLLAEPAEDDPAWADAPGRLDRAQRTLAAVQTQLTEAEAKLQAAKSTAERAVALAQSALTTAESATDGVNALEEARG
jgi:chromosome segregation ATPase